MLGQLGLLVLVLVVEKVLNLALGRLYWDGKVWVDTWDMVGKKEDKAYKACR